VDAVQPRGTALFRPVTPKGLLRLVSAESAPGPFHVKRSAAARCAGIVTRDRFT
jgi:hypothetical protein